MVFHKTVASFLEYNTLAAKYSIDTSTMRRVLAIFLAYAYGAACVPFEKAPCQENAQCNVGYYCNLDHYSCLKCMRCEDLKRAALPVLSSCIKSIAECGPCLEGLAADPSGNLDAPCVPADSLPGPDPSYMWIALVAAAICLLLLVGALLYVLRNTDTFKMVSFTRASFQSPCASGPRAEPGVPPPPYAAGAGVGMPAAYVPVRPTSPPLEPEASLAQEDSSHPFIKRADSRRVRAPRERDSNQEAQVFNNPHYVRGPELPPSYDSTVNGEEANPELHDEETMESPWTPADDANNNFAHTSTALPEPGSAAELSTLLSEARGTTVVRPPDRADRADRADRDEATPSKVVCVRQDSNNGARRGRLEPGEGSAGAPPAAPPHLTALNFNITVQQHNDVKLIST